MKFGNFEKQPHSSTEVSRTTTTEVVPEILPHEESFESLEHVLEDAEPVTHEKRLAYLEAHGYLDERD